MKISETQRSLKATTTYCLAALTTDYESLICVASGGLSDLDHQILTQQAVMSEMIDKTQPYIVIQGSNAGFIISFMPCFDDTIDNWMMEYPLSNKFKILLSMAHANSALLLIAS